MSLCNLSIISRQNEHSCTLYICFNKIMCHLLSMIMIHTCNILEVDIFIQTRWRRNIYSDHFISIYSISSLTCYGWYTWLWYWLLYGYTWTKLSNSICSVRANGYPVFIRILINTFWIERERKYKNVITAVWSHIILRCFLTLIFQILIMSIIHSVIIMRRNNTAMQINFLMQLSMYLWRIYNNIHNNKLWCKQIMVSW